MTAQTVEDYGLLSETDSRDLDLKLHTNRTMKIGILGGSFDPFTTAHFQTANAAHTATDPDQNYDQILDEVWLMPCAGHTFGKELSPAQDRINMIEAALGGYNHFKVCLYEIKNESKGSTYETLKALTDKIDTLPLELYFIIGSDNTQSIEKWVQWERLISEFRFMVVPRVGYQVADWAQEKPHVTISVSNPSDISSTKIRNLYRSGKGSEARRFTFPRVADYIEANNLYIGE